MLKDLRHAVRVLLRAKGWTAVVILSLALGIGANTAIFTGVNALLLTRIPVTDPDTLVRLRYGGRNESPHLRRRHRDRRLCVLRVRRDAMGGDERDDGR